jgi:hypothetical protein
LQTVHAKVIFGRISDAFLAIFILFFSPVDDWQLSSSRFLKTDRPVGRCLQLVAGDLRVFNLSVESAPFGFLTETSGRSLSNGPVRAVLVPSAP